MSDYNETQTITFDVRGISGVQALEQAVIKEEAAVKQSTATHAQAAKAIYEFADVYDLVDQAVTQAEAVVRKATVANQQHADSLKAVGVAALNIKTDFDNVEKSVGSTRKGMGQLQQQIMAGSYAFQDFTATSGGLAQKLNSVTNNLPMIFAGMGQLGVAISIAGTAAVALYQNWDSVTGLFEHRNPFPKTAGDLDGMKKKLEDVNKELGKLREQGTVNDAGLARVGELQKEESDLKAAIKLREKIDGLKEQRSEAENLVVKAFQEAIKETGAKKSLETLEADMKSSHVEQDRNGFRDLLTKINEGNLDAFRALLDFAKESPKKYGNLAREMEAKLKEAFKQDGLEKPMDAAVEAMQEALGKRFNVFNDLRKVSKENTDRIDQLNKQGREEQQEMVEGMAKEAKEGTLAIVAEPLEALAIKNRAMGASVLREVKHLKNEAEAEAARLFPELQKMFPKAFEGVVAGIVRAVRESVDKTIEQLQAMEGLTKQEAIRRLNQQRQAKGQANAEGLALDEFSQAAARNANKAAALNGGPPVTPEQAREMGQQAQARMQQAGVSAHGQVAIGKAMNTPGGEKAIEEAMEALQGAGLDEAGAMRALPNVLNQMANGRGAGQAVDQFLNGQDRQQRAAQNRAMNEAARPQPRFRRGQANAGPRGGGGFRSVAPNAPGEDGGGSLEGVQAAAQGIVQAHGNLAGRVSGIESILGQVVTAMRRMNGQNANQLRRAMQNGETFLGDSR